MSLARSEILVGLARVAAGAAAVGALFLLSKLDLATPGERAATESLIATHAPRARVIASAFGDVSPALLLGSVEPSPPQPGSGSAHALYARTIEIVKPFSAARLEVLLESLATRLEASDWNAITRAKRLSLEITALVDGPFGTPPPRALEMSRVD